MAVCSLTFALDVVGNPSLATVTTEDWQGGDDFTTRHDLRTERGRDAARHYLRSMLVLLEEADSAPRLALVPHSPRSSG